MVCLVGDQVAAPKISVEEYQICVSERAIGSTVEEWFYLIFI